MITLRPYQQQTYDLILGKLGNVDKLLVQAETGWGKSILIGKLANQFKGRTLILTHRIELLTQNSEWIKDVGLLTANIKHPQILRERKNVIAMTQTAHARFKKYGSDYLGEFDNIIIDEVHVDYFKRVYNDIEFKKLIGLTATPIIYKKDTKKVDGQLFTRKLTLADDFDDIIQGIGVQELIDLGYLTQDKYLQLKPPNLDKLKQSTTNPDGFTPSSLTDVFGSHATTRMVINACDRFKGSKIIMFNPTTKVNNIIYKALLEHGYDTDSVKMYDSVNSSKEDRESIVNWFKNTDGSILLNVGVFTTGFNVPSIDTVIYNKATMSLSLYLQSVGRGGRVYENKESFYIVDLGLNIERHGFWSDARDWSEHFKIHKWKSKKPSDLLQVWECGNCGFYNLNGTFYNEEKEQIECAECGTKKPKKESKPNYINGELVEVKKPRVPTATNIMKYVELVGGDANLAFRLAEKQIIALFYDYTKKIHYFDNRDRYIERVYQIYRPIYFSIIRSSLKGANKKLDTQVEKIFKKLDKHYENQTELA